MNTEVAQTFQKIILNIVEMQDIFLYFYTNTIKVKGSLHGNNEAMLKEITQHSFNMSYR